MGADFSRSPDVLGFGGWTRSLFSSGARPLPTEQVPLHIFEPRYRELIGERLDNEQPFGLVFADDDGLRQIGTLSDVVEVTDRFDDGRLNIVVEGASGFVWPSSPTDGASTLGRSRPSIDADDPPAHEDVDARSSSSAAWSS